MGMNNTEEKTETLDDWMKKVDQVCLRRLGLTTMDLPDQPYADWFEEEMTPREAYASILEAMGEEELI